MHINEAVKPFGFSYSIFINKLKLAKIELDRKVLSEMATMHVAAFKSLVEKVK
jgi:large subunit ribosomal protein L20